MILRMVLIIALSCAPIVASAQTRGTQNPARGASDVTGMVITGDRDAPLVLHIVPWQEPASAELPKAPRQRLLPGVVDRLRSVVDEPANRPLGQAAKATR